MSKPFFSPEELTLIRNFLLGGAAVGATTGSLAGLVNSINRTKQKAKPDTTADDGIVYVDMPDKMASLTGKLLAPGLALGGATIAGMKMHELIQNLYKRRVLEQAQKELDESQVIDVNAIARKLDAEEEQQKAAAAGPITFPQLIYSGVPVGLATVLAYAANDVSQKALRRMFPGVRTNASPKPTRVVIRSKDDVEDIPVTDDAEKKAALNEFILDMACGVDADNKLGLLGIVKAAAMGESGLVLSLLREGNIDMAMDHLGKEYESAETSFSNKRAALRLLASDPGASPVLMPLACGAVITASQAHAVMVKGASEANPNFSDHMEKVALAYIGDARLIAFCRLGRPSEEEFRKAAAAVPGDMSSLLSMLMDADDESGYDNISGAESNLSTAEQKPILTEGDIKARRRRRNKPNKDIIDGILESTKSPAQV